MDPLSQFIAALPKAENHLHVEGMVPWTLVHKNGGQEIPLIPEWYQNDYQFEDFTDFGRVIFQGLQHVLNTPQRYAEIAAAYFEQLVQQNVRYVEISVSVGGTIRRNLDVAEVVYAIQSAAPPDLIVRVIAGINRRDDVTRDSEQARIIFGTPGFVGLDLHGDERVKGPEAFVDIYHAAQERDFLMRAHAGELTGADTIKRTIDILHVSRIEHGTLGWNDDALVERLIAENITLDMCPTSNVKLGVVNSYVEHPIGHLLRRGVRVTCSTDDPPVFNVSLTDELHSLVKYQHFTAAELARLQINAFEAALIPETTRAALIAEVEALLTTFDYKISQ